MPVPWSQASTLGETVVRIVRERRTDSDEFRSLVQFYGREKLLKLYYETTGIPVPGPKETVGQSPISSVQKEEPNVQEPQTPSLPDPDSPRAEAADPGELEAVDGMQPPLGDLLD